jgi:hypothetical protein
MPMDEVKDKVYRQETVRLDGKLFLNYSFEDCLLSYGRSGGSGNIVASPIVASCSMAAANNTVQVPQGLGFKVTPPKIVQLAFPTNAGRLVGPIPASLVPCVFALRLWLTWGAKSHTLRPIPAHPPGVSAFPAHILLLCARQDRHVAYSQGDLPWLESPCF